MSLRTDKKLDDKLSKLPIPVKGIDGNWPHVDDWPQLRAIAVCSTTGCPVEGIGFEVTLYVQTDGSLACVCGRCTEPVTDLRGDITPVGQSKLAELKANPHALSRKQRDFNNQKSKPKKVDGK